MCACVRQIQTHLAGPERSIDDFKFVARVLFEGIWHCHIGVLRREGVLYFRMGAVFQRSSERLSKLRLRLVCPDSSGLCLLLQLSVAHMADVQKTLLLFGGQIRFGCTARTLPLPACGYLFKICNTIVIGWYEATEFGREAKR